MTGNIEPEKALAIVGLVWLIGSVLAMARSIRRGRQLSDALAARHPETYESSGRPRPGFFQSTRRNAFSLFIARREYERLSDPVLAAQFDAYRRAEARLVLMIVGSGVIIALLVVAARYFGLQA